MQPLKALCTVVGGALMALGWFLPWQQTVTTCPLTTPYFFCPTSTISLSDIAFGASNWHYPGLHVSTQLTALGVGLSALALMGVGFASFRQVTSTVRDFARLAQVGSVGTTIVTAWLANVSLLVGSTFIFTGLVLGAIGVWQLGISEAA
jgi:hypothetical protein